MASKSILCILFLIPALANALFVCSTHADTSDLLLNTKQGYDVLRDLTASMRMVAWQPQGSESSLTCYSLSLNLAARTWSLSYKEGTATNTVSGTLDLIQGESNYLEITRTAGSTTRYVMNTNIVNGDAVKWYISYLSDSTIGLKSCRQWFPFSEEVDYVFSTLDLSVVSSTAFKSTMDQDLRMRGKKVDISSC